VLLGWVLLCWGSHFIYSYAECHNAECHYTECRFAERRYAEDRILFIMMSCHYAECHPSFILMLNVIMLSVVILNVVLLSVVAPLRQVVILPPNVGIGWNCLSGICTGALAEWICNESKQLRYQSRWIKLILNET
jgi:hypothetical protein